MSDETGDDDDLGKNIAAAEDGLDFDEDDMAAAMAAEAAEKADDDLDFDEDDMAAAIAAEAAEKGASGPPKARAETIGDVAGVALRNAAVHDIEIDLTAVLGTAEMKVSNLLKIGRGAVIELNRKVGDTVELRVSGTAIARGEVVVVEDHLAVSITELVKK